GQYQAALNAFNTATGLTITNAEIWNDKGEALAALGQYQDAISCFNTALSLNPAYTLAQENRNASLGKGQTVIITGNPTTTMAPWYLGGVAPTSVTTTPAVATTATATGSQPAQTTGISPTTMETPAATRTTYSPLSLVPALAGLAAAAGILAWRGKNR